jgi:hypothetical protein
MLDKRKKESTMDDRNWLDRQLKEARVAVGSWSERKRAVLKAQISGRRRTSESRGGDEEAPRGSGEKRVAAKKGAWS